MQAVRRRDTAPEMRVRQLLHASGLRYRVDYPIKISGRRAIRPDVVFTRARLAVFVDGCFWHRCPEHKSTPRTNKAFWAAKLEGNAARDRDQAGWLEAEGWTVLRFWEHQSPETVTGAIEDAYADLVSEIGPMIGS